MSLGIIVSDTSHLLAMLKSKLELNWSDHVPENKAWVRYLIGIT